MNTPNKNLFALNKDGQPSDARLHICLLGILWELAHVDGAFYVSEWKFIDSLAEYAHGLGLEQSDHLFEVVERLRKGEKADLYEYINTVNKECSLRQKKYLLGALKELAIVDKQLHPYEEDFLRYVRAKLLIRDDE